MLSMLTTLLKQIFKILLLQSTLQLKLGKQFFKTLFGVSIFLLTANISFTFAECNSKMTPSTPTVRFILQGDGSTVLDTQTNLIWQRCIAGLTWDSTGESCVGTRGRYTWQQALNVPQDDWRIPNIKELSSIVEISCYYPALNVTIFPSFAIFELWSSTSNATYPWTAWSVDFHTGASSGYREKTTDYRSVRLVRSGE